MGGKETQTGERERKISRRGLFKLGLGLGGTVAAGDLGYRKFGQKMQDEENQRAEDVLKEILQAEVSRLYPEIPGFKTSTVYDPELIAKIKESPPIIRGYDENGNPVYLSFLEGEELINALRSVGYFESREELDTPREFNKARNRDGNDATRKPDGSLWTLRERIHERPDSYNLDLRNLINSTNAKNRERYRSERMPKRVKEDSNLIDAAESGAVGLGVVSLAVNWVIKRRIENERIRKEEARQQEAAAREEYNRKKEEQEAAERKRWKERFDPESIKRQSEERERLEKDFKEQLKKTAEEIKRLLEEKAKLLWEEKRREAAEGTVEDRLTLFFDVAKIDLRVLKLLSPKNREIIVKRVRQGAALLLYDADQELLAKINATLDKTDPKFDIRPPYDDKSDAEKFKEEEEGRKRAFENANGGSDAISEISDSGSADQDGGFRQSNYKKLR